MSSVSTSYQALVQKIIPHGKHGPYAVAQSDDIPGWITFSLNKPVWQEEEEPKPGTYVILSDLRKKDGWRAEKARFYRPGDDK